MRAWWGVMLSLASIYLVLAAQALVTALGSASRGLWRRWS